MKPYRKVLGPQELEYIRLRAIGRRSLPAAVEAGYENPESDAKNLMASPLVQRALLKAYEAEAGTWAGIARKLQTTIDEVLGAETHRSTRCPHCSKTFAYRVADYAVRIAAVNAAAAILRNSGMADTLTLRAEREDRALSQDELTRQILGSATIREVIPIIIPPNQEPS